MFYPISNDFMFCSVLAEKKDLSIQVLELILGIKIADLKVLNAQQIKNYTGREKSVRFDVYAEDEQGTRFDVEIQTTRQPDIDKRIRYYHHSILRGALAAGQPYKELPDSYVIMICTYDPFGKGDAVYRFMTMNTKYGDQLRYNDGAYTYILNARSHDETISDDLRDFLQYIATGSPQKSGLTAEIQKYVDYLNTDARWRETMSSLEDIKEISRQEGIAEGLTKGRAQGLTEGLTKGRAQGLTEGLTRGRLELIQNMLHSGYDEDTVQKALKVSQQEILTAKNGLSKNS